MRRFAGHPAADRRGDLVLGRVVELAAVAVGELEAVDGLAVHRHQLGRVHARRRAGDPRGQAVQEPTPVGASHLEQCVPGRRLVVEADVGVGVGQALRAASSNALTIAASSATGSGAGIFSSSSARAGRVAASARRTWKRLERGAVAPRGDRWRRGCRGRVGEHARHRREQAGTVPARDLDPPLARVERQHRRRAPRCAPGAARAAPPAARRRRASCASRYARGACRIRSATYRSSPTMRIASARRRSTRLRASSPVTSGCSSSSITKRVAARRGARAPTGSRSPSASVSR